MSQLTIQLLLGLGIIGAATALQSFVIGVAMMLRPKLARHVRKAALFWMIAVIAAGTLLMLLGITVSVFLWAGALQWLGAFDQFEPSLYFALASYTTLGFGDVLPSRDWRILGAMIGANGMLGFGLATAALVEFVRGMRRLPLTELTSGTQSD